MLCWLAIGWQVSRGALGAEDWPQFLGPSRDGVARLDGPVGEVAELWRASIGSGLSGPVVAAGKVIIFHRRASDEMVEAVEASTGKRLWSYKYPSSYRDSFGADDDGPRSTPTVASGRVFTLGAEGRLQALELDSGKPLWTIDFRAEHAAAGGFFGFGCSPLVEKDAVILNVGGKNGAGVIAVESSTGKVRWKATDDESSYSSPTAMETPTGRAIVLFTRSGLRLLDAASGEIRASFPWRARIQASVNAMTPVIHAGQIFLSSSYGTGAVLLRLTVSGVESVWSSDEALSAHYATPMLHHGHLFGFDGRVDAGTPSFRCVELATGKVKWSADRFGGGSVLLAGSELVLLTEAGELVTAPAAVTGWKEARRRKILDGPVRAYPAIAAGRLFARCAGTLVAIDLKASATSSK